MAADQGHAALFSQLDGFEMNLGEPRWMSKVLTNSDVDSNQCRLLIKPDNPEIIPRGDWHEMELKAYDRDGKTYNMVLAKVKGRANLFRLRSGWNQFSRAHELRANDLVIVWILGFSQIDSGLGAVLLNCRDAIAGNETDELMQLHHLLRDWQAAEVLLQLGENF